MTTTERAETFDVYLHERGKRPRKVDTADAKARIKSTITVEGKTYYWIGADLSARTLTYTDTRGGHAAE